MYLLPKNKLDLIYQLVIKQLVEKVDNDDNQENGLFWKINILREK